MNRNPPFLIEEVPVPTPRPVQAIQDVMAPAPAPQEFEGFSADEFSVDPAPVLGPDTTADEFTVDPIPGFTAEDFTPGDQPWTERFISGPLTRGKNNMLDQSANVAGFLTGVMSPDEFAAAVLKDRAEAAARPRDPRDEAGLQAIVGGMSPEAKARQAELDAIANDPALDFDTRMRAQMERNQTVSDEHDRMLGAAAQNPGAAVVVGMESLPSVVPTVGGGLAGGAAGSVAGPVGSAVGAAAGMGLGSGAIEFANSVIGVLEEKGLSVDQATLAAAVQDPQIMAEAYDYATKRVFLLLHGMLLVQVWRAALLALSPKSLAVELALALPVLVPKQARRPEPAWQAKQLRRSQPRARYPRRAKSCLRAWPKFPAPQSKCRVRSSRGT
jgi:hypothetical protein